MKEISNNLAFRSTLVCLSITKKHFWLCSQTQRTKKILFVSETFSLKVEFVLQSAPFSVPHTSFSLLTVVVPLPHQYHFLPFPFFIFLNI